MFNNLNLGHLLSPFPPATPPKTQFAPRRGVSPIRGSFRCGSPSLKQSPNPKLPTPGGVLDDDSNRGRWLCPIEKAAAAFSPSPGFLSKETHFFAGWKTSAIFCWRCLIKSYSWRFVPFHFHSWKKKHNWIWIHFSSLILNTRHNSNSNLKKTSSSLTYYQPNKSHHRKPFFSLVFARSVGGDSSHLHVQVFDSSLTIFVVPEVHVRRVNVWEQLHLKLHSAIWFIFSKNTPVVISTIMISESVLICISKDM